MPADLRNPKPPTGEAAPSARERDTYRPSDAPPIIPTRRRVRFEPGYVLRILSSFLTGSLALALLLLAGYGAFYLFFEPNVIEPPTTLSSAEPEPEPEPDESIVPLPPALQNPVAIGPELDLDVEGRPEDSEISVPQVRDAEPMSVVEIADAVCPSVVAVLQYDRDTDAPVAAGSGFILDSDGYIVTNAHLVDSGDRLTVVLLDGAEHEASLVGADARTDLAVLKIDAANLIAVTFGNSDDVRLGEDVVVLGNSGGVGYVPSVARGILSVLSRDVLPTTESVSTIACFQLDAAVGASGTGGPLVDVYGRVIGLCSLSLCAEGCENASFAVPSNTLLPIVRDLVQFGRVTGRVWLGVDAVVIDNARARLYHLPVGLMISTIYEGSNLLDAGIRPGDILLTIDGTEMDSLETLRGLLDTRSPGDLVTTMVFRPDDAEGYVLQISFYLLEDTGSLLGTVVPKAAS